MERKKKTDQVEKVKQEEVQQDKIMTEEPEVRWVNNGGSFWLNGHIMKPGQSFRAKVSDIPEAFRDVLTPNGTLPDSAKPPIAGVSATYSIKPREDEENTFDVINDKGKALNGKPLTKEKAENLLKNLQA